MWFQKNNQLEISIRSFNRKTKSIFRFPQDNAKLLEQLKYGFKRTINWKYQSEVSTERQSQYLDFLIGPSLLFVLSFENEDDRKVHKGYSFPKLEIKYYNVMIDEKIFFDQPVKSGMKIYDKRLQ